MARKGNPISLRMYLNRSSDSSWFSDYYYSKLVYQDVNLRSYFGSIRPPTRLTFGFRLGRCIILHFPKRTFIHFFLPKRRKKTRPGKEKGRWWTFGKVGPIGCLHSSDDTEEEGNEVKGWGARKRVESIRLDDRKKQNEIRIWPKKKQRYGYHDRPPSRKILISKLLRVSGAFKHPKYAGVVNDIAFLIENDNFFRKTKLFKFFFPMKSRSDGPTSHLLKRTLPAVRPSLNYSVMQYLLNTKKKRNLMRQGRVLLRWVLSVVCFSFLLFSLDFLFQWAGLDSGALMCRKLAPVLGAHAINTFVFYFFGGSALLGTICGFAGKAIFGFLAGEADLSKAMFPGEFSSGTGLALPSSSSSWTEDSFGMRVLLEPFSETEMEGTSVNQPEAGPVPPANPVAPRGDEAGPSNPVIHFPYQLDEVIGGDSVISIQQRLLAKKVYPSAEVIEWARIEAEDLFEVKVEIIRRMTPLDPEGDWERRGARALDNPRTATGEESLGGLHALLDDLNQRGVESQAFRYLKEKVFRKRTNFDEHSET